MQVAKIAIGDVDLMQELANRPPTGDTRGYETRYLQLSEGGFGGEFWTVREGDGLLAELEGTKEQGGRLALGRQVRNASYQRYRARTRLSGSTPSDRACFLLFLPSTRIALWQGTPVLPSTLLEHPPGCEMDLVLEEAEFVTFSFRDDVHAALAAAIGGVGQGGARCLTPSSGTRLGRSVCAYLNGLRANEQPSEAEPGILEAFVQAHMESLEEVIPRSSGARRRDATRRAEAFLHEQSHRAVSSHELAAVAGIPLRSLQDGFRREFGLSPHAFHERLRMQRASRCLMSAQDDSTRVSDVAYAHGFEHLGRFSVRYKRTFGESPSETLRRRAIPR